MNLQKMTLSELERLQAALAVEIAKRSEMTRGDLQWNLEGAAMYAIKTKGWLAYAVLCARDAQGVA